jgi:esterase/lipase
VKYLVTEYHICLSIVKLAPSHLITMPVPDHYIRHFLDVNDEIENLRLQLQEEKDKFVKEKSSLDGQIKKLKTLCKAKDTKLSKLMSDTGSQSSESSQMSVLESEIHFLKTDADTLKEVLLSFQSHHLHQENDLLSAVA